MKLDQQLNQTERENKEYKRVTKEIDSFFKRFDKGVCPKCGAALETPGWFSLLGETEIVCPNSCNYGFSIFEKEYNISLEGVNNNNKDTLLPSLKKEIEEEIRKMLPNSYANVVYYLSN